MKAVAVVKPGEEARLVELPVPSPGRDQFRVKMVAAAVNPVDGKKASGIYGEFPVPFVPGIDGAGVVDLAGDDAEGFTLGQRVFGRLGDGGHGTFAEYAVISGDGIVAPIPEGLDFVVAAAIPIAGLTALGVLRELSLSPGENVLAIGATGGVGTFFTQLAARAGLEVIATSRPAFAERTRRLGARAIVDHTSAVPVPEQLRSVGVTEIGSLVDFAGAKQLVEAVAGLVAPGGKAISIAGGVAVEKMAALGIEASNFHRRASREMLEELGTMVRDGDVEVVVERRLSLTDGPWVLEESRSNHMHGKSVLKIDVEADPGDT